MLIDPEIQSNMTQNTYLSAIKILTPCFVNYMIQVF